MLPFGSKGATFWGNGADHRGRVKLAFGALLRHFSNSADHRRRGSLRGSNGDIWGKSADHRRRGRLPFGALRATFGVKVLTIGDGGDYPLGP